MLMDFFVKDKASRRTFFRKKTENGLYPLRLSRKHINSFRPAAFLGERVSFDIWHSRISHPSSRILHITLFKFAVPHSQSSSLASICSSCKLGKSKKLPFSSSLSFSTKPLELIHCDVWGSAPTASISGFQILYYFY